MRKVYAKPEFVVEGYTFTDTIAACDMHYGEPDTNEVISIKVGTNVCAVGDHGHEAGNGTVKVTGEFITIFGEQCDINWNDGSNASLAEKLYGCNANIKNHSMVLNGKTFWS